MLPSNIYCFHNDNTAINVAININVKANDIPIALLLSFIIKCFNKRIVSQTECSVLIIYMTLIPSFTWNMASMHTCVHYSL